MRANYLIVLLLFTLSCTRDDDQLDCPGQADRGIDLLRGPALSSVVSENFLFLSNQYGGRGQVNESAATYPLFLNWPEGCQDEYTANVLRYNAGYWLGMGMSSWYVRERIVMSSFWGLQAGRSHTLPTQLTVPDFPKYDIRKKTILVTNVPAFDYLTFSYQIGLDYHWDAATETLEIQVPDTPNRLPYVYAYIRLAGQSAYHSLLLKLTGWQGVEYDFTATAMPMETKTIRLGGFVKRARVYEVVDAEAGHVAQLALDNNVGTDDLSFGLPMSGRPILIRLERPNDIENKELVLQAAFDEVPSFIPELRAPITALKCSEDYVYITSSTPGLVSILSERESVFQGPLNQRILQGPIPAQQLQVRIPQVPPYLEERHTSIGSLTNPHEDGYLLEFWHHPTLQLLQEYEEIERLPWIERQQYTYYREVGE